MYTFDGVNKKIIISSNDKDINILDLYSRWKEWVIKSDNIKFFPAFEADSKYDITGKLIHVFYLINEWDILLIHHKTSEINIINGFVFNKQ